MALDLRLLRNVARRLYDDRFSWESHWGDLRDFILPNRTNWLSSSNAGRKFNAGRKKRAEIIDSTGSMASRTLQSGLSGGVTSPARPWFRLSHPDPGINEVHGVRLWLDEVTRRMLSMFARSNLYQALPTLYGDMGTFGIGAMFMVEDDKDGVRFFSLPIGSYALSTNARGLPDTFARKMVMSVRQIVEQFGIQSTSESVASMFRRGEFENEIEITHLILPNTEVTRGDSGVDKPYLSVYWEEGLASEEDDFLSVRGFDEFPVLAARWDVTDNEPYGTSSPGMIALGDVKALQRIQTRKLQAIEKLVHPPMTGPSSLRSQTANLLPGGITYIDGRDPSQGFRPSHAVDPQGVVAASAEIVEHQRRIKDAFFTDLFLLLTSNPRGTPETATEVALKQEEKVVVLGPTLERLNDELLDKLIDRSFNVMVRRNAIPEPPPEISGDPLRVEYVSILAQAQRMIGISRIERFVGFVGSLSSAKPEALDRIDVDGTIDEYIDALAVPASTVTSVRDAEARRQARAQRQAQLEQREQAQQAIESAKVLSETEVRGDTALGALTGV